MAFVWGRMVASRGGVRVERLAAEVGWSRKRLWSRFRARSPTRNAPAQLVRFDHAAHRLAAGHSAARVAAETGYADQSHLHREVMAFTGATPTAVGGAPWLAVDDVAWPPPRTCRTTEPDRAGAKRPPRTEPCDPAATRTASCGPAISRGKSASHDSHPHQVVVTRHPPRPRRSHTAATRTKSE